MIQEQENIYTKNIKSLIEQNIVRNKTRNIEKENDKLITNWNIGKEIVKAGNEDKIKYGNSYIKNLSVELTNLYGSGYDYTNLRRMKQFYLLFPNCATLSHNFITWSHIIEILPIKNINKRHYYINLVNKNNLSIRKLREEIKNNAYERLNSKHLSQSIDNVLTNINERNPVKLRDYTPEILVNNGVKNLPTYENPSHIRKNILTAREAYNIGLSVMPKDNYHGLGKNTYIKAIDSLDNPRVIFKNRDNKNYLILTTIKDACDNIIIIPIEIETTTDVNRLRININRVKSVYGKSNLNNYIKKNINQKEFFKIYEQKKEQGTGPIPAASSFSKNTISNPNKKVKLNISTK